MTTNPSDVSYNYSNAYNSRAKLLLLGKNNIEWWLRDFTLPDISIPTFEQNLVPNKVVFPGTATVQYGEFSCSIFVDEELKVYEECYDWIMSSVAGDSYSNPSIPALLLIYNNQMVSVLKQFKFTDMLIKSMSSLQYNNYGNEELTLTLGFAYDKFELVKS